MWIMKENSLLILDRQIQYSLGWKLPQDTIQVQVVVVTFHLTKFPNRHHLKSESMQFLPIDLIPIIL